MEQDGYENWTRINQETIVHSGQYVRRQDDFWKTERLLRMSEARFE